MAGILISYRRDDSGGVAGRLYDRLSQHFGPDRVFQDVADIAPGEDFHTALERALENCTALVVVIGPRWADAADASGQRRLHRDDDYVRLEVGGALARGARVFPVLVGDARIPVADELPAELAGLTRQQALEVRNEHFHRDVDALVDAISHVVRPLSAGASSRALHRYVGGAGIAAGVIAAVYAGLSFDRKLVAPLPGGTENPAAAAPAQDSERPSVRSPRRTGGAGATLPAPGSAIALSSADLAGEQALMLDPGVMYRFVLEQGQALNFDPAGAAREQKIILDAVSERGSNIQSRLYIVSGEATTWTELGFNEIHHARLLGRVPEIAATGHLRLYNEYGRTRYYLTLLDPGIEGFVPFLGERIPQPMRPGERTTGVLEQDQYVWHSIELGVGKYDLAVEMAQFDGAHTNLLGTLTQRHGDGTSVQTLLTINEIGAGTKQTVLLPVPRAGTTILELHNINRTIEYALSVTSR